ncbi:hypothetical protein SynROS8604_02708 [Synechococcus sp. ROS8604]|nr:hypothetical protein SynROS8604_02708 [Synechococcus sp. ROS8604]
MTAFPSCEGPSRWPRSIGMASLLSLAWLIAMVERYHS